VVNHSSQSLTGIRNGAAFATDATYMGAGTVQNNEAATSVGSQGGGTYGFWNGDIAEIVVFNTALSTADRARVESYLAAKWGISGVHAPATATSDPVGAWLDKSGNARHATQGTAGSRPTISATALNGKKQLAIASTQGNCLATQSLTLDAPYSLLAVVSSSARRIGAFAGSLSSNTQFGDGNAAYSGAYYGAIRVGGAVYGSAPIATGRAQVFSAVASAGSLPSSLSMFSDGIGGQSAVVFAGTAPNNRLGGPLEVGSSSTSSWGGTICEMIAYSKALSTSERQRLERYLAAKYGITLAPQVSNADAQDWINRVYANGGTVSASTASAVNTLCDSLDAASLRDRFYRLNLFCGSNLNAALVPLYRGPSLGGTQYGNTTDTNNAFVGVGTDYAENSGLKGNGSTKSLATGLLVDLLTAADSHMSVGLVTAESSSGFKSLMGANISLNTWELYARRSAGSGVAAACFGSATNEAHRFGNDVVAATLAAGHIVASYPAMYRNGAAAGTTATSNGTVGSIAVSVFAQNSSGSIGSHTDARLSSYSIGRGMTASQVASFSTAHAAFNAAMGRA
jgi:hypothetical protein